jgi:geranylgeranyl diphosphate synthase type I
MLLKIRKRIDRELVRFLHALDKEYAVKKISPLLSEYIREFVLRKGKRIRPVLFVIAYLGLAKKETPGLYASALSLELLHDFMLVHDDIVDKSDTRRGKPSMHRRFDAYLSRYKNLKFSGQDLAIVAGDVMYAIAIHAFLAIKENMVRKEMALKKFIQAAIYTGSGEFIELLCGTKDITRTSREDIYNIYDFKTANYTFATPLASGAILAGASKREVERLFQYGIYLGRAFQIKDDILGMFGAEKTIGKSNLTDLKEAKKTLLIWRAFNRADKKNKKFIASILGRKNADRKDLLRMRKIVTATGALDYCQNQIRRSIVQAESLIAASDIGPPYKNALQALAREFLL